MRRVSVLMIAAALVMSGLLIVPPSRAESLRLPTNLRRSDDSNNSDRDDSNRDNRDSTDRRPTANPVRSSTEVEEFKYRLVVQGSSDSLLRQVRQIVPDAFRTTVDGRRMIQAGLFVEREEAETTERQLDRLNATTTILELDRPIVRRSNPVSTSSSVKTGFNYRLVVQGSSDSLLRQVRQIIPDAFRITFDGQTVIQAGLFVEREEAETVQDQLARLRTETSIFDIDYGTVGRISRSVASSSLSVPARDGRTLVVVDPGHGGGDPGAVGISGLQEAGVVLDIAQEVTALLEEKGVQAVLTRTDDREIDLAPRVNLAERLNADLFVSIHANSISLSRPDVNGIETYYYSDGSSLASSIHNSLVNATGMNDRGVRQARFYVLTRTSMPAVLVEVGFVTGREDAARLSNSAAREQIAAAIVEGILGYLR